METKRLHTKFIRLPTAVTATKDPSAAPAVNVSYTPLQVAQMYAFPAGSGAGQTVGIVELGGGYSIEDVQTFFDQLSVDATPQLTDVQRRKR